MLEPAAYGLDNEQIFNYAEQVHGFVEISATHARKKRRAWRQQFPLQSSASVLFT